MIGNRRLGIGSAAEISSFSFTHPTTAGNTYQFRIATSTGYYIIVDSANNRKPVTAATAYTSDTTTLSIPTPPAVAAYITYTVIAGATSCTVFSTNSTGVPTGTITQLDFPGLGTLLTATALDISKCARSLTYIRLEGQTSISSVTGLSSCKALTELQANSCGFTSLDCTPLTELLTVVASNQSALAAFTAGPKLKSLTIFNCPVLPTSAFFLRAANLTLEVLNCNTCPLLANLQLGYNSVTTDPLLMNLAKLKVLNVSSTGIYSSGQGQGGYYFWPGASKNTLQTITATNLAYISSLSLVLGGNTGVWPALTSLNLSNSDLQNDPWRIPTTVTSLNLQGIRFGETSAAPMGFDLTDCTGLTDFSAVFGDMSLAIVRTPSYTSSMTTTAARELILDRSGFTSINIQQTGAGVLANYPLLKLSAQGMPNLTSFTLGNPAWLKTIKITNNPKLTSVSITGATNRTLVDITVTISGNSLLTSQNLTGSGTIPWTSKRLLPTVTSITPNYGPLAPGTAITITGTNFIAGESSVTVGGVAATSVDVAAGFILTATTPASAAAGQKSVLVTTTTAGTSVVTTAAATNFNYQTIPTLTGFSPRGGQPAGGTKVTFTGTGFLSVTSIVVNSKAFTGIVITSDTSMYAFSPAGAVDLIIHAISVINPSGADSLRFTTTGSSGWLYL